MNWNDITLDQFNRIKTFDLTDLDGQISAAEVILGIKADDMTWKEFSKECVKLNFLDKPIPETIIRKTYTLNGRVYKTEPNLNELNVARYMDFTNLIPTGELEKILAVVLIPEGGKYGDNLEQVYEDIKTMSIVDVYAVFNFFKLEFKTSLKTLADYSVRSLRKDKKLRKVVSAAMDSCSMLGL